MKPVATEWKKSSFSGAQGDCVEVQTRNGGARRVRDSNHPRGPMLEFTPGEWDAFINGVKAGEFD